MSDLRSLFLGDLSVYCTEKDVKEFFQPFGPIEAIKLKRGSSDKNHLSYGFVRFVHPESAAAALERLQGVVFLGRPIRLGWAQRNIGKKYQPRDPNENYKTAQIHVSFISKQVDALVSEATLRSLFGMYGPVLDVTIKKSQFDQKLRIQNGYGFVHYPMTVEGIQAAILSTRNIHQVTVDRVTYDCSLSHSLEQIVESDPLLTQLWNSPKEHPPISGLSNPSDGIGGSFSPRTSDVGKDFESSSRYTSPRPSDVLAGRSGPPSRNMSPRPSDVRDMSPRAYTRDMSPRAFEHRDLSPRAFESRDMSPRALDSRNTSPRPSDSRNMSPRPSDLDRSLSTYTSLPLPPSGESSLHSFADLDISFVRDSSRFMTSRSNPHRRPSEAFSEISVESLDHLANLSLGSSLRTSPRTSPRLAPSTVDIASINSNYLNHHHVNNNINTSSLYESSSLLREHRDHHLQPPQQQQSQNHLNHHLQQTQLPPQPFRVFSSLEDTKRYF